MLADLNNLREVMNITFHPPLAAFVVLAVLLIEIWLLVFCCGKGQKYAGKVFAAGWAIQLVWILGLAFKATWLFEWIGIYYMMIAGLLISFAGMIGVAVKRQFR